MGVAEPLAPGLVERSDEEGPRGTAVAVVFTKRHEPMFTTVAVNVALLGMFALYLLLNRERRSQRLFIAVIGALVGSLVGRMLVNPSTLGHFAFVAGGAALFVAVDWALRSNRSTSSGV